MFKGHSSKGRVSVFMNKNKKKALRAKKLESVTHVPIKSKEGQIGGSHNVRAFGS